MRFIPTKFHAPLDYIVGVALIAAPWIFQFSDVTAAAAVSIVLGHRTDRLQPVHELRARRLEGRADGRAQPDRRHCRWPSRRVAADLRLRDESANVWVPHLVVGLAAVFLGLTTVQKGGYSYHKSSTPTPAAN